MAIDKDETAVRVAWENIKRNNLDSKIQVVKGDKLQDINFKADVIVANIVADVIIDLAKDVPLYLNENGIFCFRDYKRS